MPDSLSSSRWFLPLPATGARKLSARSIFYPERTVPPPQPPAPLHHRCTFRLPEPLPSRHAMITETLCTYTMRNFRDHELLRWRPARGRARAEGAQRVGRSGGSSRRAAEPGLFPHFAPRRVTCCFAEASGERIGFGELTVEECGVEWSTVE